MGQKAAEFPAALGLRHSYVEKLFPPEPTSTGGIFEELGAFRAGRPFPNCLMTVFYDSSATVRYRSNSGNHMLL